MLVPPEHPTRFIVEFVDALDLEALGFRERRRPNWRSPHPVAKLLKLFLYAWFERIHSMRAMPRVFRWDLRFLFLSDCDPPGRSSVGRFWRDNHSAFIAVFEMLVRGAAEAGLVGMDLHALDGTKVRAACSLETGVHRTSTKKNSTS